MLVSFVVSACNRTVSHESSGQFDAIEVDAGAAYELPRNDVAPYDGPHGRARVPGGQSYARGVMNLTAPDGSDGYYGAAFYLPHGTLTGSDPAQKATLQLMGWKDSGGGTGSVRISPTDHKARLMRGPSEEIGQRFTLREGCWNSIVVHQRLSDGTSGPPPLNEVFLNGDKVVDSNAPNSFGLGAESVRFGIVSVAPQADPLELYVDDAYWSAEYRAPPRANACEPLPNVLFLITDDQRADTVTPALMPDTLKWFRSGDAANGIAGGTDFDEAYATTALCCPSRATIFSGRYAHNHGVRANHLATSLDQRYTLQQYLRRNGYHNAIYGKFLNGWDVWPPGTKAGDTDPADDPPGFDDFSIWQESAYPAGIRVHSSDGTTLTDKYSTTWLEERTLDFLQRREDDDATPWFLHLSIAAPHESLPSPEGNARLVEPQYANAPVPPLDANPARSEGAPGGDPITDKPSWTRTFSDNRTIFRHGQYPGLREQSLRSLYSVDDLVENVFQRLRALGEERDTLAVLVSDNGYYWREHGDASLEQAPPSDDCSIPPEAPPANCPQQPQGVGLSAKARPYTEAIKVPMLMRWPRDSRVATGVTSERLVANVDLAPTVMDAAGASLEPGEPPMDGMSLLGPGQRPRMLNEGWLQSGMPQWASIRTAPWSPEHYQYIQYYTSGLREYYDLRSDPFQLHNLYGGDGQYGTADDLPGAPEPSALSTQVTQDRTCAGATCPR